jgi:hypothetical protein
MKYYFETNALYSIGKIQKKYIDSIYTSILSLYELVSGIRNDNFTKRKNILNNILNSSITIEWDMPEKIIFDSFGVTKDYEYEEHRVEPLKIIINKIQCSDSFEIFSQSMECNSKTINFNYFKELDKLWSKGFIDRTIKGNQRIKDNIIRNNNSFTINNIEYNIRKNKDLESFYKREKLLNQSITIFALSTMVKENGITESDEVIYKSYNGLIDIYIEVFSFFCANKMILHETPATNDFADLTHLIYLKNNADYKIVSNDNIFDKFFNHKSIKIEELINN